MYNNVHNLNYKRQELYINSSTTPLQLGEKNRDVKKKPSIWIVRVKTETEIWYTTGIEVSQVRDTVFTL